MLLSFLYIEKVLNFIYIYLFLCPPGGLGWFTQCTRAVHSVYYIS